MDLHGTSHAYAALVWQWAKVNVFYIDVVVLTAVVAAWLYWSYYRRPNYQGEQGMQERERQKAVIAEVVTNAIDNAYLADRLPKKSRKFWYARLAKALDIKDLQPRRTKKPKKISVAAVKAKINKFKIAKAGPVKEIPGPKPGDPLTFPAIPETVNKFLMKRRAS